MFIYYSVLIALCLILFVIVRDEEETSPVSNQINYGPTKIEHTKNVGLSPKDYGQYLLRSGKYTQNKRKIKQHGK
tara:strand:+ start:255 stop:479 length:225 start_codon:yes stop_codon:yes gene_type:complete